MNKTLLYLICLCLPVACKSKKKHSAEDVGFFPVLSYLKGQSADVDTSLYRIIKIETIGNKPDTSYIKREEFKKYAAEFLDIPDISSPKLKEDYEESKMFDEQMNALIFTYMTHVPENEIKREDVIVDPQPDEKGNNKVKTIVIDEWKEDNGTSIHKNMVWQSGKRFLILTKSQKDHNPENITKLEVVWNDFP